MHKVLLVEDSDEYQLIVSRALANADIQLTIVGTQAEAKELIQLRGGSFDLAILDLSLPDGDGFQVLDDLRAAGMSFEAPIFFLTSHSELTTKVTAFNLGADDYLIKPISPIELRARIEMRLKKTKSQHPETLLRGDLAIEMTFLRASRKQDGQLVDLGLTAKEFKILAFLVHNENKVFSRTEIVEAVWGSGIHILDRTVDSHIYGLRKKMGNLADSIDCIPGAGYRFIENAAHIKVS